MGYFQGEGVTGLLHPSLRAYIECFNSPPFPKAWPRGGGIWDQDPTLVRDFRMIAKFEREWKEAQSQMNNAPAEFGVNQASASISTDSVPHGGGGLGLGNALNQYLESIGEDGHF